MVNTIHNFFDGWLRLRLHDKNYVWLWLWLWLWFHTKPWLQLRFHEPWLHAHAWPSPGCHLLSWTPVLTGICPCMVSVPTCIPQMTYMLECFKKNDFSDKQCAKEIQAFYECQQKQEVKQAYLIFCNDWFINIMFEPYVSWFKVTQNPIYIVP